MSFNMSTAYLSNFNSASSNRSPCFASYKYCTGALVELNSTRIPASTKP